MNELSRVMAWTIVGTSSRGADALDADKNMKVSDCEHIWHKNKEYVIMYHNHLIVTEPRLINHKAHAIAVQLDSNTPMST